MTIRENEIRAILRGAREAGRDALLEPEGYRVLEALGIPVPPSLVVPDAATAARLDLTGLPGDRVVVKVISAAILHKSDVGGVAFAPRDPARVAETVSAMAGRLADRRIEGFLIAGFVPSDGAPGSELLLGARATADFGPVVTLGAGGVYAEHLARALRPGSETTILAPSIASRRMVESALARNALVPMITGALRGQSPRIEPAALADLVERFLTFAAAFIPGDVAEFEVNPLVLSPAGPVALDVLAKLADVPSLARGGAATGGRAGGGAGRDEGSRHGSAAGTAPGDAERARRAEKLARLLAPRSIAVFGVSARMNPGHIILRNILREGFPAERVVIVKPGRESLDGCRCVPDVASLPAPVDLAILAVSADQAPARLEELIRDGKAESVILIPGGLGEREGSDGLVRRMEEALAASRATAWGGPVVVGGNCLGVRSRPGRYDTLFIPGHKLPPPEGPETPLALLSQSGAFAVARASRLGHLNPRYIVTWGNQLDLAAGDYLAHLAADPAIRVFACYVEGFRSGDGTRWLDAASAITAGGRSVILYRAGRTAEGAAASASHTASIAGDYAVTRELARAAGVLVAESLEEFEDFIRLAVALDRRPAAGLRLGAVSNAGFECVALADNATGLHLAEPAPPTRARLDALLAEHRLGAIVGARNPLDLTPMMEDRAFAACCRAMLEDPGVDVGVVGCVPLTGALSTLAPGPGHDEDLDREGGIARELIALWSETTKPWVVAVDSGALYDPLARRLEAGGLPVFRHADRAVRMLARLVTHRRETER